jgi:hypothetical protein
MDAEFKRITVPVIAMQDLVKAEAHWNLVHIDVQGMSSLSASRP